MAINNFFKGAVGVAMGAFATLSPMTADAGDVEYGTLLDKTPGYIKLAGPVASGKERIALIVNGGDRDFFMAVLKASDAISDETQKQVTVLLSKDQTPNDGSVDIDIYYNGGKTGTLSVDDTVYINEKLAAVVDDGIKRETASLEQPDTLTPKS